LFQYNPGEAKRLLAGRKIKITLTTTPDRFRQSLALVYAAQWRAIGVDARVRVQDWGSLYQDMKKGNFEAFSAVWIPVVEPDLLHWVFHSSNIPDQDKGGGNRGAYVDEQIDEMLVAARGQMDLDKRRATYEKIETRLLETMPYIPLWFLDEIVVMNRSVLDFTPSRTGSLWGLTRTHLTPSPSPIRRGEFASPIGRGRREASGEVDFD
jgi:peptide/nickel transport system substrate-binding protein